MSQANRYLGSFCSFQRIFPPQIIQVLLIITERVDDIPLLLEQMQRMGLPTL